MHFTKEIIRYQVIGIERMCRNSNSSLFHCWSFLHSGILQPCGRKSYTIRRYVKYLHSLAFANEVMAATMKSGLKAFSKWINVWILKLNRKCRYDDGQEKTNV